MQCKLFADIKPNVIMVGLERHWSTEAIDSWLSANPPRTHAPERSLNKMVTAYVSQPLPPASLDALSSCNYKLADFSRGMTTCGISLLSVTDLNYIQLSLYPIKLQTLSRPLAYGPLRSYLAGIGMNP